MSLSQDIQPWIDAETGLITSPDGGRDNLPLMTATLIRLLPPEERPHWRMVFVLFEGAAAVVPGLYKVDFHRLQGMSPDNIVGHCIATQMSFIYSYGIRSTWTCNVLSPYKFGIKNGVWYLIGFVPMIKICAGVKVSLFGRLEIFLAALTNPWSAYSNTSNKCLQYLWNTQLPKSSWTVRLWNWQMMRKYKGGLKELYGIYFGPTHPFTNYAGSDFK